MDRIERYMAAGGVVVDDGWVLVLRWPSRHEVRLPKGHVEAGETVREAALREANEESGYADLRIEADLGSQEVEFEDEGRRVIRKERYFLMTCGGGARGPAGSGEAKFDPVWLPWDGALEALTFAAEREWVRRARRIMAREEASAGEQ